MSMVNEVIGTATEMFETATFKSTIYAQIAKLKVKITSESNGLKELYAQLGQAYFERLENGETGEFGRDICEKILASRAKISASQQEIDELKQKMAASDAARAEARAEKKAAAARAENEDPEEEVEITIEVPADEEEVARQVDEEVSAIQQEVQKAAEADVPPVATLYVDESAQSENRE